jgi:maltose alpha-D-glucosyltransferase/alpha-amylase
VLSRAGEKLAPDPAWYRDAIIYEVRVRSFFDSNDDGIGDFRGLTGKLDYLQDLGVNAIWVLPFYPSPLRDDGYDIADYTDVHPDVGTLADLEELVAAAHRRGIRIITELVLNHTSDQHPWFKRARRAPPGSVERDFYVWSDTSDRYREARIIFKDFEHSNWSWDPVVKAYYWHRFYAHQPDLNFGSPAVREALLGVVDFWFDKGIDGLRLDAVPYLYEAEGTNCENLPETHAFIRELRAHVDSRYADKMLLAEANQWPEDASAYFGDGDECHMNFHFPLMPRMFMAIHMEDRFPLLDILAQTPQLPPSCQWALFLRNHDELTLEMVTDEERDYMYRAYAHDTAMRINLGIRRRLAPLVGNDRRKMELLTGLLLSLPGTPVLYYGDELGMGDNVYLGDRNGVRTPMQWSADRNAGFSRANPQRLILPVIIDPEYHYESLNAEAQQNNTNSLLWWTKRLIALRKRFRAFGRGSIEFLTPENHRVLAFVREHEGESVLVVANLSRFVQFVELDLARWRGTVPHELGGHTAFPPIGELPYLLTLGGHAFYWFALEPPTAAAEAATAYEPPVIECASAEGLLAGRGDDHHDERALLAEALTLFATTRRWFRRRGRRLTGSRLVELVPLGDVTLALLEVEYATADRETYLMPLGLAPDGAGGVRAPPAAGATIATLRTATGDVSLVDAVEESHGARALLDGVLARRQAATATGRVVATGPTGAGAEPSPSYEGEPTNISAAHLNAAIRYGDQYLLKVFRRLEDGPSPQLELGAFLGVRVPGMTPEIAGAIEYRRPRQEPNTLAVLQRYVPNEGTAWTQAREELGRFYERVLTESRGEVVPPRPRDSWSALAAAEPPPGLRALLGQYLEVAAPLLGRRTAELHLALASSSDDPAFAPEPYSAFDRRSKYQSLRNLIGRTLRELRGHARTLPGGLAEPALLLVGSEARILRWLEPFLTRKVNGARIRTHGDLHLAQVLHTGKDYVFIDFDGGRSGRLTDRRRKRSALKDVAGILRSFHYAAAMALLDESVVREADRATVAPWSEIWRAWTGAAFLRGYLERTEGASFLPPTPEHLAPMLDILLVERAFLELSEELEAGQDTLAVPLEGLVQLLDLTTIG